MEHNIYIVLSRSDTLFAKAIRLFTKKKYSHTSLSFEKSLDTFYSFGRRNPKYMFPAGFITEGVARGFFKLHPEIPICVLEGKVTQQQFDDIQKRLKPFIDNPLKYKYDVMGLIPMMMGIAKEKTNHYTCSCFVAHVLGGCYTYDRDYSLMYPEDFYQLNLKKIYEGAACDYAKQ